MTSAVKTRSSSWETRYEQAGHFHDPHCMGSWGMRHAHAEYQGGSGFSIPERYRQSGSVLRKFAGRISAPPIDQAYQKNMAHKPSRRPGIHVFLHHGQSAVYTGLPI